ncbi:MAG: hypothetical protein PGN34_10335 [Methylobacterium frigidaeris]
MSIQTGRRLGVAFVGMGGAVATTAIAGIEMIKAGSNRLDGLPLAGKAVAGMTDYKDLVFGGWDLNGDDLGAARDRARRPDPAGHRERGPGPQHHEAVAGGRQREVLPQHRRPEPHRRA